MDIGSLKDKGTGVETLRSMEVDTCTLKDRVVGMGMSALKGRCLGVTVHRLRCLRRPLQGHWCLRW